MKLKKRPRTRTYCGLTAEQIREVQITLCNLQEDVGLTDMETDAMDIAIQALADVRNAMTTDGRIRWERR